jgi:hypothetical protein
MVRRIALGALASVVLAASAGAQVGRRGQYAADPGYWVGLSVGYVTGLTTTDNQTNATWAFGYSAQLRATLEKSLQPGVSIGISAGFSNPSLTYYGAGFDPTCPGPCQAHADVTQYLAFLHGGLGGRNIGFHGIYTLEGGVTQFANFRDVLTDTQLGASSSSYDLTFGIGGGFGYTLSPTMEAYAEEVGDFILHQQSSQVTSQSAPHTFTLRAGLRVGF